MYDRYFQAYPTDPVEAWIEVSLKLALKESLIRICSRSGGDHLKAFPIEGYP